MKKLISLWMAELIVLLPLSMAFSIYVDPVPVQEVNYDSAKVVWRTSVPALGSVNYGLLSNSLDKRAEEQSLVTDHEVRLFPLLNNTRYYLEIVSTDSTGTSVVSRRNSLAYEFKTLQTPDNIAPKFATAVVIAIPSETTAAFSWTSSEAASTIIYYGTGPELAKAEESQRSTTHSITITVESGTTYNYKAGMCDSAGNCVNSTLDSFIGGIDTTPLEIESDIPEYAKGRTITVTGTTKPLCTVNLYVNSQLKRYAKANLQGQFKITGVELVADSANSVTLEAVDQTGNAMTKDYTVTVDNKPPILKVEAIPLISNSQSLQVKGSVDELCSVTFSVYGAKDLLPPEKITGLKTASIGTNSVKLSWDKSNDKDFFRYALYRDGTRITATHENLFTDIGATVDSGKTYVYSVSAVDKTCNEGMKSDSLTVTTKTGGQTYAQAPGEVNLTCDKYSYTRTINVQGDFQESINLQQGMNYINIEAKDKAGHVATYENTTAYDSEAPRILEHNLDKISPSYIDEVTIRGRVSEQATILVYVNSNSSPTQTETDSDGNFQLDVRLKRELKTDYFERNRAGLDNEGANYVYGDAWENKVKLVAVDKAGLKAEASSSIILTQCGLGSWWKIYNTPATPEMLTPRLIIEGMAIIGISFNLSWQGGFDNGTIRSLDLTTMPVNQEEEEKWDRGWVAIDFIKSADNKKAYAMIKLKAQDPSQGKNWTMLQKEENISNHRLGDCLAPGFGCVRIPLMLKVTFDTTGYNQSMQQRQCIDVEVAIDRRIPPDKIPEEFLKASIAALNSTINLIDDVLEPIRTIKEYVFYACAASWVVDFVMWVKEAWACEFTGNLNVFNLIAKEGSFDKRVAQTGKCEAVYKQEGQDQNNDKYDTCVTCMETIRARKEFEKNMQWLCDRIFCPSIPTLQKFIRDQAKEDPIESFTANGIPITSGSDCALVSRRQTTYTVGTGAAQSNYRVTDTGTVEAWSLDFGWLPSGQYKTETDLIRIAGKSGQNFILTADKAKEIYDQYKAKNKDCIELHPATAECCGTEYMQRWDTGCVLMDELNDNVCWHAENEAKLATAKDVWGLQCNVLFNKAAGICAPDGTVQTDPIATGLVYKDTNNDDKTLITNPCTLTLDRLRGDSPEIYINIVPPNKVTGNKDYEVYRGYVLSSYSRQEKDKNAKEPAKEFQLNKDIYFRLGADANNDLTDYFFIPGKSQENDKKKDPIREGQCKIHPGCGKFMDNLNQCTTINDRQAGELYMRIQERIGYKEKEYIAEPASGFLRSIQCVCLSAITGYLNLYKSMLTAVRNCFQTILVTGDGSAGVCRAVVTVYVCDLIYDAIRCFMDKYGGSAQRETGFELGNIVGALTKAGEGVQKTIAGRYGKSAMWKAMFAERKIVHSLCLFAWTGTWDLDVQSLINQDFSTPLETEAFIWPAERRFVAFNPVSNPSGLTTWNYHLGVGLIAGAELNNIRLKLVCSDDYSCSPSDGFENGKCDCPGGAMDFTIPDIPNTLKPGGIIMSEGDIYKNVQNAKVRYDKAVLEWSYIDNNQKPQYGKVEQKIRQVGGAAPAFCKFDAGSGSFRCELSIGDEKWAKFNKDPKAEYGYNNDAFRPGQQLQFSVDIQQQIPSGMSCSTENCEYTKYLRIVVTNQNGRVIYSETDQNMRLLNTKGSYKDTITMKTVERGDFTGAQTKPTVSLVSGKTGASDAYDQADIIASRVEQTSFPLYIGVEPSGATSKYTVCQGQPSCCEQIAQSNFIMTGRYIDYTPAGIRINFKVDNPKGCYRVDYTAVTSTDPCATGAQKQTWTATFEILDAKLQGTTSWVPSSQVTVYEGNTQKKPIPFSAVCEEGVVPGTTVGQCIEPGTRPNNFDCFCATEPTATGTPDCSAGKYCVDKQCIDLVGCDNSGTAKLSAKCVCNGKDYAMSKQAGTCDPTNPAEAFCFDNTCSAIPPCCMTCNCPEQQCKSCGTYCTWDSTAKGCFGIAGKPNCCMNQCSCTDSTVCRQCGPDWCKWEANKCNIVVGP
ncbi:MAG: hypothetical protein ABIF10_03440 [Candidatus Woesearchaeota archaeon]